MNEPWFGPKRYGIGIGPRGAPGWIAVGVYGVSLTAITFIGLVLRLLPMWVVALSGPVLTVALFVLIGLKSDAGPWKWRWGGR